SAHHCGLNVVASTRSYRLVRGVELAQQISRERCGLYQPHALSGPPASTVRGHDARREREGIYSHRRPPSELELGRDLRLAVRVPEGTLLAQRNGLSVRPPPEQQRLRQRSEDLANCSQRPAHLGPRRKACGDGRARAKARKR